MAELLGYIYGLRDNAFSFANGTNACFTSFLYLYK